MGEKSIQFGRFSILLSVDVDDSRRKCAGTGRYTRPKTQISQAVYVECVFGCETQTNNQTPMVRSEWRTSVIHRHKKLVEKIPNIRINWKNVGHSRFDMLNSHSNLLSIQISVHAWDAPSSQSVCNSFKAMIRKTTIFIRQDYKTSRARLLTHRNIHESSVDVHSEHSVAKLSTSTWSNRAFGPSDNE